MFNDIGIFFAISGKSCNQSSDEKYNNGAAKMQNDKNSVKKGSSFENSKQVTDS